MATLYWRADDVINPPLIDQSLPGRVDTATS